jgi:hypothetical protein
MAEMLTTWGTSLPVLPALMAFSHLEPKDLCSVSRVCHQWREVAADNGVWKRLCVHHYGEEEPALSKDGQSAKELYAQLHTSFGPKYHFVVARVRRFWREMERFLAHAAPAMAQTLRPGASEKALDDVAKKLGYPLNMDLRCLYRIHDGQSALSADEGGLLGSFTFYDYAQNLVFQPCHDLVARSRALTDGLRGPLRNSVALAGSPSMHSGIALLQATDGGVFRRSCGQHTWRYHTSLLGYLEAYLAELRAGSYVVLRSRSIFLYPNRNLPTAVTNDIVVTVGVTFAPEVSVLTPGRPDKTALVFSYNVTIVNRPTASAHPVSFVRATGRLRTTER